MARGRKSNIYGELDDIKDFVIENSCLSYDKLADRIVEEFGIILNGTNIKNWFKLRGIEKSKGVSRPSGRVTRDGFVMY